MILVRSGERSLLTRSHAGEVFAILYL
jgi:hypothetical protein